MSRSKPGTKKEVPMAYHILNKYNNNKNNMVIFYKKWKKYNKIKLTKNKMDLNIRKITHHFQESKNCKFHSVWAAWQ